MHTSGIYNYSITHFRDQRHSALVRRAGCDFTDLLRYFTLALQSLSGPCKCSLPSEPISLINIIFINLGWDKIENKFQDLLPFGILSSLLPRWDENENTFWSLANFLKQFLGPVLWIWSPWFSDDGLMTWMHFRPTKNFCWVRLRGYIQLFFHLEVHFRAFQFQMGLAKI